MYEGPICPFTYSRCEHIGPHIWASNQPRQENLYTTENGRGNIWCIKADEQGKKQREIYRIHEKKKKQQLNDGEIKEGL